MFSDEEDDDFFSSEEDEGVLVNHGEENSKKLPAGTEVKGKKHLEEMKDLFGLQELKTKTVMKREKRKRRKERQRILKKEGVVATLASLSSQHPPPEVHVFQDPQKKNKSKKEEENTVNSKEENNLPVDHRSTTTMKEARFDVFKFGLSGFDKAKKENAEEALAIRLGAKPRKNKCLPYEEFKKIRKAEKEELKEKQALKDSFAKKKVNKKADAKKSPHTEKIHTKVGKFDGGMLKLSASDIKKMKVSSGKKR